MNEYKMPEAMLVPVPFDTAIAMAKETLEVKKKFDLICCGAIYQAEFVANHNDLRPKCQEFLTALKKGGKLVGLDGFWLAEVVYDVHGYNRWNIQTDMIKSHVFEGRDGCRYYAAYAPC